MTVLSRGARTRRSGRRPGWLLLTVLLVLAIAASSALVFTNRVELLKLAVILALWAAVVAAFVSVIYRRQSDADQAKVRDLKLVYDLQLDREISARREYELTVETHLRRELSSELRAQAADEVAALRAELAALRTSLEILFDTDLAHRPAIEPERAHSEWVRGPEPARPDRVASSRITEVRDEDATPTAESPIIDVPEEPLVPPPPPPPRRPVEEPDYRGSHRQAAEETAYIPQVRIDPETNAPLPPPMPPQDWQPPANWAPVPPHATENGHVYGYPQEYLPEPPLVQEPAVDEPRGRHSGQPEPALFVPSPPPPPEPQPEPRGRHSVPGAPPAMQAPPPPEPPAAPAPEPPSRHGSADDDGPATGGHSAAELLARFQTVPGGGGRRRRRED